MQSQLRSGQLILGAFIMGQLLFAAVSVLVGGDSSAAGESATTQEATDNSQVVAFGGALGAGLIVAVTLGFAFHNFARTNARRVVAETSDDLAIEDRAMPGMGRWFTGMLLPAAFLEGIGLLAIVAAMNTGEPSFLLTLVITIGLKLVWLFPTRSRVLKFLGLDPLVTDIAGMR